MIREWRYGVARICTRVDRGVEGMIYLPRNNLRVVSLDSVFCSDQPSNCPFVLLVQYRNGKQISDFWTGDSPGGVPLSPSHTPNAWLTQMLFTYLLFFLDQIEFFFRLLGDWLRCLFFVFKTSNASLFTLSVFIFLLLFSQILFKLNQKIWIILCMRGWVWR